MSQILIRKILESALAAVTPTFSTAWENSDFVPVSGTPYQRAEIIRANPDAPTNGPFRREQGLLQVTLMYPLNKGAKDADTRADLLLVAFPKGKRMSDSGVHVTIGDGAGYVMSGFRDNDRWSVPVRFPYFSNIG